MERQMFSTKSAAAYVSDPDSPLSPRTLEKWRIVGGGPAFIRVGGRVFYSRRDLDQWLVSCRRRSTSDQGEQIRND